MICCRAKIDVSDQEGKAAEAASTAACISSGVDSGTRVITSLVACYKSSNWCEILVSNGIL